VERFFACIAPRSFLTFCQKCAKSAHFGLQKPQKTPFSPYFGPFFRLFSPKMRVGGATPFLGGTRGRGAAAPRRGGVDRVPLEGSGGNARGCKKFIRNFFPTQLRWGTRSYHDTQAHYPKCAGFHPENRHDAKWH
jgi:hypothetical protein